MNEIDWEKVDIYLHADKTGFIEEETEDSIVTLDFTWYAQS